MQKRILSLFLILVMVLILMPVTVHAAKLDNGLVYEILGDYVEITDYTGNSTNLIIPAEINGIPVTSIGDHAFSYCHDLASIDLPDSITSIGEYAFLRCSSLMSISIPKGVTIIDNYTFSGCSSLNTISIPSGVTSIYGYAFEDCSSLSYVFIPDSVTSISALAFDDCSNLAKIEVDANNLNFSNDNRGVLFNKEKTTLILAPRNIADSYQIPDSVTRIGKNAFYDCTRLNGVVIPDSVTSIDDCAFRGCTKLNNIVIPDSVIDIGTYVFATCSNITSVSLSENLWSISSGAFDGCSSLTNITFPACVEHIGNRAFANCTNLTTIHFLGSNPRRWDDTFEDVVATAYYPSNNDTWTNTVTKARYGGGIFTWVPYNPNNPFTDVPAGAFYEAPVLWALENGITTGASENSFNPGGSCLRAQVVTFLHRTAGNPNPGNANNPFTDVKTSDFFYAPVLWAVEKGITNGTGAATFGSYDVCNRAAVVTFLWRAAGSPEPESTDNPFTDVKSSDFFYKPVLWAIENGITNGVDATHFGPTSPCNRAQVVTFLYRAYN